jgi:methionyl-tRNA formyltransferase
MRILVCLNADIVSNVAMNLLLPVLREHDVAVGLSTRIGTAASGRDASEPAARRELRIAEQRFANDVLFPIVDRAGQPDLGRCLTFTEMERFRGIGVRELLNPNVGTGLAFVQAFEPDVVVSIRYGAIFKAPAIAVPRLGVINLHAGLLPAYRGVIATFRALMARESEIGCTLHYIVDGTIDTGPVLAQSRTPVDPTRSLLWHIVSLYPSGVMLIGDALARLDRGETLDGHAQSGGSYYSYPSAEEWDEFRARGWRVADPSDLYDLSSRYITA